MNKKGAAAVVEAVAVVENAPVRLTGGFVIPDGSTYVGGYVEGNGTRSREGQGTYVNGPESYSGMWLQDSMHGNGKYIFCSGAVYEGGFKNGMFDGEGTFVYPDGAKYTGGWMNNKFHGKGHYIDANKISWEGDFFNGMFDSGKSYISLRPGSSVM